jgi:hypothetical protein
MQVRAMGRVGMQSIIIDDSVAYQLHRIAGDCSGSHWKHLLTGWSLVRIRPGEPVHIDFIMFSSNFR